MTNTYFTIHNFFVEYNGFCGIQQKGVTSKVKVEHKSPCNNTFNINNPLNNRLNKVNNK